MNTIFIEKLKKAINSSHPIENINELIREYDELKRLAQWRINVLKEGKNIDRYEKKLKRINDILKKNGYRDSIIKTEIDFNVEQYFKKK